MAIKARPPRVYKTAKGKKYIKINGHKHYIKGKNVVSFVINNVIRNSKGTQRERKNRLPRAKGAKVPTVNKFDNRMLALSSSLDAYKRGLDKERHEERVQDLTRENDQLRNNLLQQQLNPPINIPNNPPINITNNPPNINIPAISNLVTVNNPLKIYSNIPEVTLKGF